MSRVIRSVRKAILARLAEKTLQDEGLLTLPVDLKKLAKSRDIAIEKMPSNEGGVSGMLLRHGNSFGILYNTNDSNYGFQRFSIAHEFGHYFIPGHVDEIFKADEEHRSRAGFVANDRYEREADHFAASLLMPKNLMQEVTRDRNDGFDAIEAMKEKAQTSLTASAIRYIDITETATAVVSSCGGIVDYCFMSDVLKAQRGIEWCKKGSSIPMRTVTATMTEQGTGLSPGLKDDGETDVSRWFSSNNETIGVEEVVCLDNRGRILTILTFPDLLDEAFMDEDDHSDEAVKERWTPRHHR